MTHLAPSAPDPGIVYAPRQLTRRRGPRPPRTGPTVYRTAGRITVDLLVLGGWSVAYAVPLQPGFPQWAAPLWMAAVAVAFFVVHVSGTVYAPSPRLRPLLRPLGGTGGWVLLAVPLAAAFGALLDVCYRMLPSVQAMPPLELPTETAAGRLAAAILLVVIAPLLEEVGMRGWIQQSLRQHVGTAGAVGLTALLFAALHGSVTWLPYYTVLGMLLGYALVVTGSIWAPVALHAGHNGMVLLSELVPEWLSLEDPRGGAAALAVVATLALAAALVGIARMARRERQREELESLQRTPATAA